MPFDSGSGKQAIAQRWSDKPDTTRVQVRIPNDLLEQLDSAADNRSAFIVKALRLALEPSQPKTR